MAKKSLIVQSSTSPELTAVPDSQVSASSIDICAAVPDVSLTTTPGPDPATASAVIVPVEAPGDAEPSNEAAAVKTPLTAQERKQLAECETKIASGLKSFFEVGRAMRAVRDAGLYRETHLNIEDYAEERWDIRRAYLYQLIAAADVYDTLKGVADVLPACEYQTRRLAASDADDQKTVWQYVVDNAGNAPITAKAIKSAIADLIPSDDEDAGDSQPVFDCKALSDMPKKMVKLLVVSDITSDNPAVAADKLRDVLAHSALAWASDCHLLVVSRCGDSRAMKALIEEYSFELGVSLVWEQPSVRRPLNWSFGRSEIEILHARCGQATINESLTNVINCGEGDQGEELPFALAQLIIKCTTKPGDLVATAGGMKTMQLAAETLSRALLSVRPEAGDHVALAA